MKQTKDQQLVRLAINYQSFVLPIDAAYAIHKAMLSAKFIDRCYVSGQSYGVLVRPEVSVRTHDDDEGYPTFDTTCLNKAQVQEWRAAVNEGLKNGGKVEDILPPEEFKTITKQP